MPLDCQHEFLYRMNMEDKRPQELWGAVIDEELSLKIQAMICLMVSKEMPDMQCGHPVAYAIDAAEKLAKKLNVRIDARWMQKIDDPDT